MRSQFLDNRGENENVIAKLRGLQLGLLLAQLMPPLPPPPAVNKLGLTERAAAAKQKVSKIIGKKPSGGQWVSKRLVKLWVRGGQKLEFLFRFGEQ